MYDGASSNNLTRRVSGSKEPQPREFNQFDGSYREASTHTTRAELRARDG